MAKSVLLLERDLAAAQERVKDLETWADHALSFFSGLNAMYAAVMEDEGMEQPNPMGAMAFALYESGMKLLVKQ